MFPAEMAFKEGASRTHQDAVFSSLNTSRYVRERERENVSLRNKSKRTLLVQHMEGPKNMKISCYRVLQNTRVVWTAVARRLE